MWECLYETPFGFNFVKGILEEFSTSDGRISASPYTERQDKDYSSRLRSCFLRSLGSR